MSFVEAAFGVGNAQAVTLEMTTAFVLAPGVDGTSPSTALVHLRRSTLRLLFRALRHAGAAVGDPTLDLKLPPRSQLSSGALADDEVACVAIIDVLTRAGLAGEPDVRPASVVAWSGQRILAESGRIDVVARRLGMASLDRTARFIAFDWSAAS